MRKLRKLGFVGPQYSNGHPFMYRGKFKLKIPNDHKEDYSRALIADLQRRSGLSKDDWDRAK